MLREFRDVRQIEGEGQRRWFFDDFFDLIVWYTEEGGKFEGFQLCYDKQDLERALTWTRENGYKHNKIDDGEAMAGRSKMTPILVQDGLFDKETITDRFKSVSETVPEDILSFVIEKLEAFSL